LEELEELLDEPWWVLVSERRGLFFGDEDELLEFF
jgi:hypothetical protein